MKISIVDVGPRDGLQNEATVLAPQVRAELCDRLAAAGVRRMEAASFVHPKLVPQMADAEGVMASLQRVPGTSYAGLILNERGYERARSAWVDEVRYAFPVTETFARRNQNATVAESVERARRIVSLARQDGLRVGVILSTAFGDPWEGRVDPAVVLSVAEQVREAGPDEIVLADTIGVGVPRQVRELVTHVRLLDVVTGCHFHNTRNTGYANALAAIEAGATVLDSSIGGIGGCPFAPRATGNIATEDLLYLLHGMGYDTGIDLARLADISAWLEVLLGKELPGQVYKAGHFPVT